MSEKKAREQRQQVRLGLGGAVPTKYIRIDHKRKVIRLDKEGKEYKDVIVKHQIKLDPTCLRHHFQLAKKGG